VHNSIWSPQRCVLSWYLPYRWGNWGRLSEHKISELAMSPPRLPEPVHSTEADEIVLGMSWSKARCPSLTGSVFPTCCQIRYKASSQVSIKGEENAQSWCTHPFFLWKMLRWRDLVWTSGVLPDWEVAEDQPGLWEQDSVSSDKALTSWRPGTSGCVEHVFDLNCHLEICLEFHWFWHFIFDKLVLQIASPTTLTCC
jgi:hypothetical protein